MNLNDRLTKFRQELQTRWTDLTATDLDEVSTDITRLKEKLKSRYRMDDAAATVESQRFTDSFDSTHSLDHEDKWEDRGEPAAQEKDHPETEMIRNGKDNGSYGTAATASSLHRST